jgi:hypothetical protein
MANRRGVKKNPHEGFARDKEVIVCEEQDLIIYNKTDFAVRATNVR